MITVDLTGQGLPSPNNPGQLAFCNDWENEMVGLEGGMGAGKTWGGARKLLTLHIYNSFDEHGVSTMVKSAGLTPTYPMAREFMVPEILQACEEANLDAIFKMSRMEIVFPDLGGDILIRTAEHPERIAGWEIGAGWGDEPARWKCDTFDPLRNPILQFIARLRDPNANFRQIFWTYTNEGDHTYIYEEMHRDLPGRALYRARTKENPIVADYYESQKASLTEELARQYLEGEALSLRGGKVYPSFDKALNVSDKLELVPNVSLQLALDFNISPGMHGELGQYNTAADMFTTVYEIHAPRMSVQDLVVALGVLLDEIGTDKFPVLEIYGDATGNAEWSGVGLSCYEILRQGLQGLAIPFKFMVPKTNPLVVDRVNAVNVALQDLEKNVHWKIHPRCKRLITDLQKLKRGDDGMIDKRERKLSHASDGDGYRIYAQRPARVLRPREPGRINA